MYNVHYTARKYRYATIERVPYVVSFELYVESLMKLYNIRIHSNILYFNIGHSIPSHEFMCLKYISQEAVISVLSSTIYL